MFFIVLFSNRPPESGHESESSTDEEGDEKGAMDNKRVPHPSDSLVSDDDVEEDEGSGEDEEEDPALDINKGDSLPASEFKDVK